MRLGRSPPVSPLTPLRLKGKTCLFRTSCFAAVAVVFGRQVTVLGGLLRGFETPWREAPTATRRSKLRSNGNADGNTDADDGGVGGRAPPFAFAACLTLQDDNTLLPEWLAYNYQVMPLRYLIVSADPGNVTSPEPIFDQWRELGMRIDVWPDSLGYATRPDQLKRRQEHFRRRCLEHLKDRNWTWTMFTDTDEFVAPNPVREDEGPPWLCSGFKLRTNNATRIEECVTNMREAHRRKETPRSRVPSKLGRRTVADYIASELDLNPMWREKPCILFPRIFFGPQESSMDVVSTGVPDGFNASLFTTLRYRKYGEQQRAGKSIMDASRYDGGKVGIHLILRNHEQCNYGISTPPHDEAIFRIHHYTLPLEVYLNRPNDCRRTEESYMGLYEVKTDYQDVSDDARGWLEAFVATVGKEKAFELTERARATAFVEDARLKKSFTGGMCNVTSNVTSVSG